MSSASHPPLSSGPPRPSVFISYASEDRLPTRQLREALTAAGLEVWYDENELGGGDAWDQKIRRQIRECTYFMPVVSATTEARREGYFRREWRLATERSLDMADDVMFLVPVVIDDTPEMGARVPEKFLTVQWLRLPGGQPTPGLALFAQRLLAHDHASPPLARGTASPLPPRPPSAAAAAKSPPVPSDDLPPMPPFPVRPADHQVKYLAEVLWWVVTVAWLIIKRLPKMVRVLLSLWFVFAVIRCSRDDEVPKARENPAHVDQTPGAKGDSTDDAEAASAALKEAAQKLEQTAAAKDTGNLGAGFARAGADVMRAVSEEINDDGMPAGRLGVIPFDAGVDDPAEKKFARQIFDATFGQLAQAHPRLVRSLPLTGALPDDVALQGLATRHGDQFFLTAQFSGAADARSLEVRLLSTKDSAPLWSGRFATANVEAADIASQVTQGVHDAFPKPKRHK